MLRVALALWGLLFATQAWAQVSGSAALVSDYRFRGVSLSDQNPAAQLSIAYDHSSGWYAGAFASTAELADQTRRNLQTLAYAGYARRSRPGLNWEVGASYSAFSGAGSYDYPEVYIGIAWDKLSGRIYYAPDYFGQRSRVLYGELNGALALRDRLHLIGHVGALQANNGSAESVGSSRYRFDVRAGVGIDLERASVQLAWVASNAANTLYPVNNSRDRNRVVLSLSRSF
jgi:uncharacterized protein (TIGR02001 family)